MSNKISIYRNCTKNYNNYNLLETVIIKINCSTTILQNDSYYK